jgi:Fe-S-cluster-containing dehydrogenase component
MLAAATATTPVSSASPRVRLPLLQKYLAEQQELSAVERFAQQHDDESLSDQARHYEHLLPATAPGPGQQYSFSVDLDRCSGCKACVTGCHSLNGLDESETWRSVGLLQGGKLENPLQQTVTTACHHCVEPGCLKGCPVNAYEKDEQTGIVRHLDDQCIGCQYCTMTCPYDVPQYNPRLGIVRKCDMCSSRLKAGEAPACVQACPTEAIAIRLVDVKEVIEKAAAERFLPDSPSPRSTLPTTSYRTERELPENTTAADAHNLKPAHNHVPLVVMLVLTQLSVGAFALDYLAALHGLPQGAHRLIALIALGLGLLGLGASVFHLGRPLYAFRALVGLLHSWMSREVLFFGLFGAFAPLYVASLWLTPLAELVHLPAFSEELRAQLESLLGAATLVNGLLGVACSVLLYAVTGRRWWRLSATGAKFFGTALGSGTLLVAQVLLAHDVSEAHSASTSSWALLVFGSLLASAKLFGELSVVSHRDANTWTDFKRTALLLTIHLRPLLELRIALAVLGVAAPWVVLMAAPNRAIALAALACAGLALVMGEFLERSLFFMAVAPARMPGAVGQ